MDILWFCLSEKIWLVLSVWRHNSWHVNSWHGLLPQYRSLVYSQPRKQTALWSTSSQFSLTGPCFLLEHIALGSSVPPVGVIQSSQFYWNLLTSLPLLKKGNRRINLSKPALCIPCPLFFQNICLCSCLAFVLTCGYLLWYYILEAPSDTSLSSKGRSSMCDIKHDQLSFPQNSHKSRWHVPQNTADCSAYRAAPSRLRGCFSYGEWGAWGGSLTRTLLQGALVGLWGQRSKEYSELLFQTYSIRSGRDCFLEIHWAPASSSNWSTQGIIHLKQTCFSTAELTPIILALWRPRHEDDQESGITTGLEYLANSRPVWPVWIFSNQNKPKNKINKRKPTTNQQTTSRLEGWKQAVRRVLQFPQTHVYVLSRLTEFSF